MGLADHRAACDNVISATVVLADGRVVAANEAENADLFWGIKGLSLNSEYMQDSFVADINKAVHHNSV